MHPNFRTSFPLFVLFVVISIIMGQGCANIVPPGGGPMDTIPPMMIRATPQNAALNVKSAKIQLQFDEFVELKNPSEQIIISPYPEKQPTIEAKLKTVSIRLKDSLLPNTTYIIDFGNALADINEGNIQKNIRHVFSTGNFIDSAVLMGRIILAETGKADSTMWALLYPKEEDSTVAKTSPAYITRLNARGYYRFDHLPAGRFYLYGLKDADGNKRYNQPIETFAFLNDAITLPQDSIAQTLYAFATEKEKKKEAASQIKDKKQSEKITFQNNLSGGALDLLDTFSFVFNRPITTLDSNGIQLYEDSLAEQKAFTIKLDSSKQRLLLRAAWKPGSNYRILLQKDFAKDSSGLTLGKNDTLKFRVKNEKEYGSVRIRFKQLDLSRNPVLLWYQNEAIVNSYPLAANEFYLKLFRPGTYAIALLYDANANGVWDAGDFFSKPRRQPEIVQAIDKQIVVKENWDNEVEIELSGNTP